jgi:hypothetical protein
MWSRPSNPWHCFILISGLAGDFQPQACLGMAFLLLCVQDLREVSWNLNITAAQAIKACFRQSNEPFIMRFPRWLFLCVMALLCFIQISSQLITRRTSVNLTNSMVVIT